LDNSIEIVINKSSFFGGIRTQISWNNQGTRKKYDLNDHHRKITDFHLERSSHPQTGNIWISHLEKKKKE
jgi:hypothetical protein